MDDKIGANNEQSALAIMNPPLAEELKILGRYTFECIGPDGEVKWTDEFPNVVTTVGKNYLLESGLAAAALTVVGPYMGLISSTSYTAVAAADTMASHGGWLEAGNANAPTYTAPRKTLAFSAASGGSKATSSAASFAITGTGTVKGAFVVLSTSAVATIDNTSGTLFSAGLFSGGDKTVANGDTINVSYTATLT
jgi:hypothetical protein